MFVIRGIPLSNKQNYGKLPNKVTHNETYKDENGFPFYYQRIVYNTVLTFDEKGAVSKLIMIPIRSQPLPSRVPILWIGV
jgi:hypothetical protein